jgi:glycosyltransferase involved in cell wall biosynthesis
MKIIYWIGQCGNKFGSLEKYNLELAEACRSHGHKLIIFHDGPNTHPKYISGLNELGAELVIIGDSYKNPLKTSFAVIRYIYSSKPDTIHLHFVNPLMVPLLRLIGIKQIYKTWHTSINSNISFRTKLIRKVLNILVTRVFAVSKKVIHDEVCAGTRPSIIFLNYLGVPINQIIDDSKFESEEPLPPGFYEIDKKVIITVGRFDEQKGMKYVVEAAVQVMQQNSNAIWWLVGREGPELSYAKTIVDNNGLSDRIIFLGQRNDVPRLLTRAYIQVVGSLYEGLGLMVLESSIFGVPTIGTQIGGLDEAILNQHTGVLVPRKSSFMLTQETLQLLNNPEMRNDLGQNAKMFVRNHFDSSLLVLQLINYYEIDYKIISKH